MSLRKRRKLVDAGPERLIVLEKDRVFHFLMSHKIEAFSFTFRNRERQEDEREAQRWHGPVVEQQRRLFQRETGPLSTD